MSCQGLECEKRGVGQFFLTERRFSAYSSVVWLRVCLVLGIAVAVVVVV